MKLEGYDTWAKFTTHFATISSSVNMLGLNMLGHVLLAPMGVSAVSASPQASGCTFSHVRGNNFTKIYETFKKVFLFTKEGQLI